MIFTNYLENPGDDYVWCSICSMHQNGNPDCNICKTGRWVNKKNPDETSEEEVRQHLESIFPNLKSK